MSKLTGHEFFFIILKSVVGNFTILWGSLHEFDWPILDLKLRITITVTSYFWLYLKNWSYNFGRNQQLYYTVSTENGYNNIIWCSQRRYNLAESRLCSWTFSFIRSKWKSTNLESLLIFCVAKCIFELFFPFCTLSHLNYLTLEQTLGGMIPWLEKNREKIVCHSKWVWVNVSVKRGWK